MDIVMEYINKLFNLKDTVVVLTGGAGILAGEMADGFLNMSVTRTLLSETANFQVAVCFSQSVENEVVPGIEPSCPLQDGNPLFCHILVFSLKYKVLVPINKRAKNSGSEDSCQKNSSF